MPTIMATIFHEELCGTFHCHANIDGREFYGVSGYPQGAFAESMMLYWKSRQPDRIARERESLESEFWRDCS